MNYRHGDLALIGIETLPNGLTESKTHILFEGKSNTHKFSGGKLYLKQVDGFVFGYLVAKNTTLLHPEHGKAVKIKDGVYQLRHQQEYTPEGMKPVVD
jgi:hypothetical protein